MKVATYVLIGPGNPTPATQRTDLANLITRRGFELTRECQDTNFAADPSRRPGARSLLADAKKRSVEAIALWRLSFLFRDVRNAVRSLSSMFELGVRIITFKEGIDTGGPLGDGFIKALNSLSQLEKDVRSENIKIGQAQAVLSGTTLGRPAKDLDRAKVAELRMAGMSIRRIALATGISKSRIAMVIQTSHAGKLPQPSNAPVTCPPTLLEGLQDSS